MRYGLTILTVGILAWAALGCRTTTGFRGQLVEFERTNDSWKSLPFPYSGTGGLHGTAFLLLEEHYDTVGLDGPAELILPDGDHAIKRHQYYPENWTLGVDDARGPGTELLLKTSIDADGAFSFGDIPPGTHTLYIRWSNRYSGPRWAKAGPFPVSIEEDQYLRLEFPTGRRQHDIVFAGGPRDGHQWLQILAPVSSVPARSALTNCSGVSEEAPSTTSMPCC